jgi:hypothetical protein
MRNGVPYVIKFVSKFCLEIAPAALASVIGAILFAQYHSQPAPAPKPVAEAVSTVPAERLAALVEEEHSLLVDYLKHDRPLPKAAEEAQAAAPAKPRVVVRDSAAKLRKPPVTADDSHSISAAPAPMRTAIFDTRAGAPLVVVEAVPAEKVAAEPQAPAAPERREGFFGSMLSKAVMIKDKAVEMSRVREAIGFVREIPGRFMPGSDKPSDAPAPTPPARFTEASS